MKVGNQQKMKTTKRRQLQASAGRKRPHQTLAWAHNLREEVYTQWYRTSLRRTQKVTNVEVETDKTTTRRRDTTTTTTTGVESKEGARQERRVKTDETTTTTTTTTRRRRRREMIVCASN